MSATSKNAQNDRIYAPAVSKRGMLHTHSTFRKSVTVSIVRECVQGGASQ